MDSPVLEHIKVWEQKEEKKFGTRIRKDGVSATVEAQAMVLYGEDGDILGMEIYGTPKVVRENGLEAERIS